MRIAFITLASKDYFPGAQKLFQTIKSHTNPDHFQSVLLTTEIDASLFFGSLFDEIRTLPTLSEKLASSEQVARFRFTLHKLYVLKFLEDSDFDRVVFFDSDLMCMSDLEYLLSPDLNSFDFLAVRDFACNKYYSQEISILGLDSGKIFNSGCFILNRSILDSLNYFDLISSISGSDKSYDGGDQGYFNFVIQNSEVKLGILPLRFNYPLDVNYPYVWIPPILVHFSGEKPWGSKLQIPKGDLQFYKYWNREISSQVELESTRSYIILIWSVRNFRVFCHLLDEKMRVFIFSLRRQITGS